jgi:hypothetical protein
MDLTKARNVNFRQNVDLPREIHNGRAFLIRLANLKC